MQRQIGNADFESGPADKSQKLSGGIRHRRQIPPDTRRNRAADYSSGANIGSHAGSMTGS